MSTVLEENIVENAVPRDQVIFWHRELPPLAAEPVGEYTLEATSNRVPGTLAHREELWSRCFKAAMAQANLRLKQEVTRLGGRYAHVLSESVDSRNNAATGEAWLHIILTYMLY